MTAHILVVEDDPDNADIAGLACASAGYDVTVAPDGAEALEAVEKSHFDLILVDLLMPRMSGTELVKTLRADPRHRATPIIGVTAVVQPEALQRLWEAGINQLVIKPYRIHTLREVVQLVLSGEKKEG